MITSERIGAEADTNAVWFVHGILGQGRNWRTMGRRVAELDPRLSVQLVDLRGHGGSGALAGPAPTIADCADDLDELARATAEPRVVVGHSFGGKVALEWLRRREASATSPVVVVLDSPPGIPTVPRTGAADPSVVVPLLRSIPVPAPDRDAMRKPLLAAGISAPTVAWLLTSARSDPDGWRWVWDLDAIESLLEDYFRIDLRPFLSATRHRIRMVRAGRSDRWGPTDTAFPLGPNVTWTVLPDAGHWVQVDDPEGTFAVVREALADALGAPGLVR